MRDRSTRLAVSVRDRAIAISFVMSSSPMINSTTSRGAAMVKASFSESPNKATMHRRKIESRPTQRFHGIAPLVIALGMAGAVAPLTTAVLSSVDDRRTGTASGFNSAIARIGGLLATALAGAVIAQSGMALVSAFHDAALIGAALALASGAVAFATLQRP